MKLIYGDIKPISGLHIAGICSVYVAPREWLAADPLADFDSGRILSAVQLKDNKFWIKIDLLQPTYDFEETPKTSKSGDYIETNLTGTLNYYNYELRQMLETLRRHDLVTMIQDQNKRRRFIGDTSTGMILSYSYKLKNGKDREESIQINLNAQTEDPAPFYNPDNEPEFNYNLLQDIDGNFLLVE